MSKNKPNGNDFDTKDLIRNQEVHSKDISSLSDRICSIENKFGNNEKIAATLKETAEKAVEMQTMLQDNFTLLLVKNESARVEIKKLINDHDRVFLAQQWKQWKVYAGAALIFILVQISTEFVRWSAHAILPSKTSEAKTNP